MKRLIVFILRKAMWIIGKVYPYCLSQSLRRYYDILYTLWLRNFVGSFGEGSSIFSPCRFWGGGNRNIKIGNNTVIQAHSILGCWVKYSGVSYTPSIIIGDNCNIGEYMHISAIDKVTIGDGLLTGRFVYIGDNAHGGLSWEEASIPPARRALKSKGKIEIGNNVWIGDKVTILGGVTIGDNVIIGANSVVTHDVPSNCVAAGNPAKVIKKLCQNQD